MPTLLARKLLPPPPPPGGGGGVGVSPLGIPHCTLRHCAVSRHFSNYFWLPNVQVWTVLCTAHWLVKDSQKKLIKRCWRCAAQRVRWQRENWDWLEPPRWCRGRWRNFNRGVRHKRVPQAVESGSHRGRVRLGHRKVLSRNLRNGVRKVVLIQQKQ